MKTVLHHRDGVDAQHPLFYEGAWRFDTGLRATLKTPLKGHSMRKPRRIDRVWGFFVSETDWRRRE